MSLSINITQGIKWLLALPRYYREKPKNLNIMSIDETLDFMEKQGHSIVRFGDGEFMILAGQSLPRYQEFSENLRGGATESYSIYKQS